MFLLGQGITMTSTTLAKGLGLAVRDVESGLILIYLSVQSDKPYSGRIAYSIAKVLAKGLGMQAASIVTSACCSYDPPELQSRSQSQRTLGQIRTGRDFRHIMG